jgi:hypothetical protein
MLKTISAALLAVSVLAAPAIAATGKTAQAPVTKSAAVTAQVKKNPLNANAKMSRHHHARHAHHRSHKKMAGKFHKVSAKPVMHPAKRG